MQDCNDEQFQIASLEFLFMPLIQTWIWSQLLGRPVGQGYMYIPITHPRFATKFLLRSDIKENEIRTQWEFYKSTEDAVYTQ